ncbi:hypothetical protein TPA0909_65460 [Streptomyces albus]|nr:hypothetical protein TPA0909_65460 [Streptomyces albus]
MFGDQRLDRPPLIRAQPGRAFPVADEIGEHGVGLSSQLCVTHASMQPDGRWNRGIGLWTTHCSYDKRTDGMRLWTTADRGSVRSVTVEA